MVDIISEVKAFKIRVAGRVQRVGYRRHVLEEARRLKLAGYVENEPDDTATIFVQGSPGSVDAFVAAVEKPPLPAVVDEVRCEQAAVNPDVKHFMVRYGSLEEELQEGFGAMQSAFIDYWREFKDYRGEFRGFRTEFRDFAERTDENFRLISEKYGEISDKLTVILNTLIQESRETREMLNETMKTLKEAVEKLTREEKVESH